MDIWQECHKRMAVVRLQGVVWRIVESQEQVATNSLVDNFDEQALLETLLEQSKPPAVATGFNYLLSTPFRYPPLPHGSRFGDRFSPSLFYGSRKPHTTLAECAYYRFLFWTGIKVPPPTGRLVTEHSLFSTRIDTSKGLHLQAPPFDQYRAELTDPTSYRHTQPLGVALRDAGIQAFEYPSARDTQGGVNMALFGPQAFVRRAPDTLQPWLCETTATTVKFSSPAGERNQFLLEEYLWEGRLPMAGG